MQTIPGPSARTIPKMSLAPFLLSARARIHETDGAQRQVYMSRVLRRAGDLRLEELLADRAPLFYRSPEHIASMLRAGYFRTAFREALLQLPTSTHFRDSHFAEILSALFAEAAIGWRLLYSKLTLLTAQNANPYKMDLILYDPNPNVPTFILAEVKSSPKSDVPARHHRSCYPSLFDSLRDYSNDDLTYDLTAARDNIDTLPDSERDIVRNALLPYAHRQVLYAGFSVIDTVTREETETSMLATRQSPKTFDIDLVCVDEFSAVSASTYTLLDNMRHV